MAFASPSSRRAWVEITLEGKGVQIVHVALLAEGVGRNWDRKAEYLAHTWSPSSRRAWVEIVGPAAGRRRRGVALLAEGVGRNILPTIKRGTVAVALLAEGVGRNSIRAIDGSDTTMSPSSRRAWVEIWSSRPARARGPSPSSRRAWVEISGAG